METSANKLPFPLWRVMVPVALGTCLSLLGDSSLYAVLPTHTAEAGVAIGSLGILLSANRWIRLGLNVPFGWFSEKWPRKWLFTAAMFLGAISTLLYGVQWGFPVFLASRILWGIAWVGIWIVGNGIIFDISTPTNRGRLIGFYNAAFFIGTSLGSILGGFLTDWLGYIMALRIEGVITLLAAIVVLVILPETGHLRPQKIKEQAKPEKKQTTNQTKGLITALALLGVNRFVVAGVVGPTFGLYLLEVLGDEPRLAGNAIGIATLTGMGLAALTLLSMVAVSWAGILSDRWQSRWAVARIGLFLGVAGLALWYLSSPWLIILGLPLLAATSGTNQGLSTTLIGDLSGAVSGRWLGFLFTIGDLTSAIGPIVAFALVDRIQISQLYLSCAVLYALTAFLVWRRITDEQAMAM